MKIEALVHNSAAWKGRCIAVSGYWQGRALFGLQSDALQKHSHSAAAIKGRRIGLYATPETLKAAPAQPARFTAVGFVGECEQLSDGSVMVMGYCHYTDGPYLAVAEMRSR